MISKSNELELENAIKKMAINNKVTLSLNEASIYSGFSESRLRLFNKHGFLFFSQPTGKKLFISKIKFDNFLQQNTPSSLDIDNLSILAS